MDYFFRAQWDLFFCLLGVISVAILVRWKFRPAVFFKHSVVSSLVQQKSHKNHPFKIVLSSLRLFVLLLLALLSARLEIVDSRSRIPVAGIDIMLVLDASGSMQAHDMGNGNSSRFDTAKQEAIRFISNRPNDACGLVLFAQEVLTRCPLTNDRWLLSTLIKDTNLGDINPDGTMLSSAIITGANRLKSSTAQSKIMIILTDGEPSQQDTDPALAIQVAQELGIKLYTIGIGSEKQEYKMHPFFGQIALPRVNTQLLSLFANETGGQFFLASDQQGMRAIYTTINELETTPREQNNYDRYYDFLPYIGLLALFLISVELLLSATRWFSLSL